MSRARRQSGWSLVELAVSLAIAALLTGLVLSLLPVARQVAGGDLQQRQLAQAEEALLGYSLSRYQLPFADSDGDGQANSGATLGLLPVRDLGLPSRLRLRYEVDNRLASAPARLFVPYLPDAYTGALSTAANGLDMCMRLSGTQRSTTPLGALGTPAAYALSLPDSVGHDAGQAGAGSIPLPGSQAAANQPALAVAAGHGELFARMSCPELLARAQGAAQNTMAAYSLSLATTFNRDFRLFDQRIAQLVKSQSEAGLALASVGLAMGIFDEAMAIILTAAGWPPSGFSIAVGIGEHVVASTSIGLSIASIVWAKADLDSAKEAIITAQTILDRAEADKTRIDRLYWDSAQAALRLEKGGTRR